MSRKPRTNKHRAKPPALSLSKAEIAEIDGLIEAKRQQDEQERRWEAEEHEVREERRRRVLARKDHTRGPWPKQLKRGHSFEHNGYVYAHEADAHPPDHPFLVELARRDGVIRYAWKPDPGIDLKNYWAKRDPGWHFIMTQVEGVHVDDWDNAVDQAIKDLLQAKIPIGRYTREYILTRHVCPDLKRRERDRDRSLATVITAEMKYLMGLLKAAGFTDEKTRAAKYLAPYWREAVQHDRKPSRFTSGPALIKWLDRHETFFI